MQTRRQFLEHTILTTTAALAAASVPAYAAQSDKTVAANDRLAVALIGAGSKGSEHARRIARHPDCDLVAVCDADLARAQGVAKANEPQSTGGIRVHQDMREVIDDKSIDVVWIATCNHWHALAAIWAIQAGKDVYLEKPVSHNISEGRRTVQAARKYKRICQVGTQYRSDGTCKAAAAYIAAGKLGQVTEGRSITYKGRSSIGPVVQAKPSASVDYDQWCGPAPMSPITRKQFHNDWHWFWETGNGDIGNSDVHRADLVRFAMGVDHLPHATMSYGGRFGYEDSAQTPNTLVSVHDFGEMIAIQEVRGLKTGKFHKQGGAIITGSEGYVGMVARGSAVFDNNGKLVEKLEGPGSPRDHHNNFIQAVRSRKVEDLNADILGGHLSAGMCHLGNISYRLGTQATPDQIGKQLASHKPFAQTQETLDRTVKHLADNGVDAQQAGLHLGPLLRFDPEKETFIKNAEADALLTRNYRKPFVVPAESEL